MAYVNRCEWKLQLFVLLIMSLLTFVCPKRSLNCNCLLSVPGCSSLEEVCFGGRERVWHGAHALDERKCWRKRGEREMGRYHNIWEKNIDVQYMYSRKIQSHISHYFAFFLFPQTKELMQDIYSSLKSKLSTLKWKDEESHSSVLNMVKVMAIIELKTVVIIIKMI